VSALSAWFETWLGQNQVSLLPPQDQEKLGISREALDGALPLHGLRHLPANGTCGWYIWAGEYSEDPNFFLPLHVSHLASRRPDAAELLSLPPGWRFYLAPDFRDVWFDSAIVHQ